MITKELLMEKFPQFKIHRANFKTGPFYLMVYKGLTFHIDIIGDKAFIRTFNWSQLSAEKHVDLTFDKVIEYINKKIIEHDTYGD